MDVWAERCEKCCPLRAHFPMSRSLQRVRAQTHSHQADVSWHKSHEQTRTISITLLFVYFGFIQLNMSSSKHKEKPQKANESVVSEKVRILCLHGYRQNGTAFKSKIGKIWDFEMDLNWMMKCILLHRFIAETFAEICRVRVLNCATRCCNGERRQWNIERISRSQRRFEELVVQQWWSNLQGNEQEWSSLWVRRYHSSDRTCLDAARPFSWHLRVLARCLPRWTHLQSQHAWL